MKEPLDKKVVELAKNIQSLAIDLNASTNFNISCSFSGFSNYFDIRVHKEGVLPTGNSIFEKHTYLDFDPKEVIEELEECIDYLNGLQREGVSNE